MKTLHTPPPSEQLYESHVPERFAGLSIERYFASRFGYQTETQWKRTIDEGRITVNGQRAAVGTRVRSQDKIVTRMGVRSEPPANRSLDVIFEDRHLRAFNKAAPIPVHPSGRFFRNSMTELLKSAYPGEVPRPVQRLDAATTGVLVFARSKTAAAHLMRAFQEQTIHKEYLALVEGIPEQRKFTVRAAIAKPNGSKRAIGDALPNAKPAETDFERLTALNDRSLLRVVPRSGRTNQIRVHLSHLGFPVVNDPVYGSARNRGEAMGLHALKLRFDLFETRMQFTAAPPAHFAPYLETAGIA